MKITVQLSGHEAFLVSTCLDFVRKNLVFDECTGAQRFVGGGHFSCNTRDLFSISYLSAKIDELREDAVNYHPFNPYINAI